MLQSKNALATILSMLSGYALLSLSQLACGIFFGWIGIPLQYYGYKAILDIISKSNCQKCAKLTEIGAKAIAFGGATVHVVCVALMPLTSKVLIPIIDMLLPNTKVVNALNMADMGIGSLITFSGLLILFEKYQKIDN